MKTLNLLVLSLLVCFTFSCKENKDEIVNPKDPIEVPHYDETNSTAVSWEQLPEELRTAIPMDISTSNSKSNARVDYSFKYGPFGGTGGWAFNILPPNGSRLFAMAIRSGSLIDKLIVWYLTPDGRIYTSSGGGPGGLYYYKTFAIDEYIYKVEGRSSKYLDRLSVYTNKKIFTYGGLGGSPFVAEVPWGYQIFGFWGKSGSLVDQIGFYGFTR